MAVYSKFLELQSGSARTVDLSTNTISVQGLQINAATGGGAITQAAHPTTSSYSIIWPAAQGGSTTYLENDGAGNLSWATISAGGGTVTSVSVASANGFAGTVANPTTTPAITIETTITASILAGNGTAISAAALPSSEIFVGNGSDLPAAVSLSGDATLANTGALTLATVNSNVGSFGSSTSIPSFTVNAKGLITAASGNAVVAPAGTLTGTTLASNVVTSSLTSLGVQAQALNMGGNQINNLADPSSAQDAATKNYVDGAINGLTWKGPVQALSDSNVALTGGATLTIDSYSVQNGDYVILSNQTTATENYVYVASGIGTAYTLTEVTNSEAPTATGDAYLVQNGTVYGNTAYQVNQITPNVTFIQFAGPNVYSFTSPLSLSGNVVSVGYDNSTIGDNGSNQLYVKDAGIGTTQLADASVTAAKLGSVTDGITLDQSGAGSTLEVKAAGISATQLATGAFDQLTIVGGAGTPASVAYSPSVQIVAVYGDTPTLAASTTYALRWGMPDNSETADQLYLADWDTSSFDLFWVAGLYNSASTTATGASITIINKGPLTLGSSDTPIGSSDQGRPVWLGSAGAFNPNSGFSPSSGDANVKLGIAESASVIFVESQVMGVS